MTESPRSILLVAQLTPPSGLIAARRAGAFAKYLGRLGHRVTVLTSRTSGEGAIEGAAEVVRTGDALATRLNWRRGHFDALTGGGESGYSPPSRLESVVVPDLALGTWLPFALPRALSIARRGDFDVVLTTSPPQSAHLVGLALARRGLPWIAELRDGWTFEPPRAAWPTRPQRRLDAALERRVARKASAMIAVTEPIVEDLRDRLGANAVLITNGFDPEELPAAEGAGALLDPERHSLVHTGRMEAARSTPVPLLEALRRLRRESPELADRLEVVFAGALSARERELLAADDLAGVVKVVGWLDRPRALALQRAADTLLVVTEGPRRRSVATGKVFEYLAARRPILVLGEGTEAARIVGDAGAGTATSASDPAAIAASLRAALERPPTAEPRDEVLERYSYPRLVDRLAALIEEVS
jgi:glycosyltransferase involved in cell wall biosynthesis